jgi:hypothetical protein
LRPDLARSDFGDGIAGPSGDGGLDEFREFGFTCAARPSDPGLQHGQRLAEQRHLRRLLLYPGVPLGQQLPQPRVHSTKPAITIIGNAGRLGHASNYTTTPPAQQIGDHRTAASSGNKPEDEDKGPTGLSSYQMESRERQDVAAPDTCADQRSGQLLRWSGTYGQRARSSSPGTGWTPPVLR